MLTALLLSASLVVAQVDASKPKADFTRIAEISCYTDGPYPYKGKGTASGARFNNFQGFTCATQYRGYTMSRSGTRKYSKAPKHPFGTYVEILNQKSGRTVVVKITDTGSYRPHKARDWFDLNYNAWHYLHPESSPSRFLDKFRFVDKAYYDAWLAKVKSG